MHEIVAEHGWPGRSLVGPDGVRTLVQHADHDRPFQAHCLELLRVAAHEGEASAVDLAYLEDRVAVGRGEPQMYGTQFREVVGADGVPRLEPALMVDPDRVDDRRAQVGLGSLAEYHRQLEELR